MKQLFFYILMVIFLSLNFIACSKSSNEKKIVSSFKFFQTAEVQLIEKNTLGPYSPRGVGGGGAMSGLSFSPYGSLWFVGTDMGTLFKSFNKGKSWLPVNQLQTKFSEDLKNGVAVGFSANPLLVFHSPGGINPTRSIDGGDTWQSIDVKLDNDEKIKYWRGHSLDSNYMYFATNKYLWQSTDAGTTFQKILATSGESVGTYLDYTKEGHHIYHATKNKILRSINNGLSFETYYENSELEIRAFTGGRNESNFTLAFIDNDGKNACRNIEIFRSGTVDTSLDNHYAHCGYVWIDHGNQNFFNTTKDGGDFLKMAENDPNTIYVTGSKNWIRQYGTKVWKSTDAGLSWDLKLHQWNWDVIPYADWSEKRIEYSAVALDIGWFDAGYESFDINLRNSNEVGGTGLFFIFTSRNGGNFWQAPFTRFADTGPKAENKKWESNGLEVTSVYRLKSHPINSKLIYAGAADIGGLMSDDAGKTFKIIHTENNSIYDFAFDADDDRIIYAATGSSHDFPTSGHREPQKFEGGIWKSSDRGLHWLRLTNKNEEFNRQFVSIGFDSINKIIYAGSMGDGIALSFDQGLSFEYFNDGLPSGSKIISQIEIDPRNGDAYILLTGNAPDYENQQSTGIYYLKSGMGEWKLLRGNILVPDEVNSRMKTDKRIKFIPWNFPTSFAVDFSKDSNRQTLWLVDHEVKGLYLQSGVWKSNNRGTTWKRMTQFTQAYSVTLDQTNPAKVYVSGFYQADGLWGSGGLISSKDQGQSWSKNNLIPYQTNAISTMLDPNDSTKVFYTFFGNAILYGPRP